MKLGQIPMCKWLGQPLRFWPRLLYLRSSLLGPVKAAQPKQQDKSCMYNTSPAAMG